jgi:hypothetical protein
MSKTVKIYFSEEDLEDMMSSFHKEEGQLWNTWSYTDPIKGKTTYIEMYLGDEEL